MTGMLALPEGCIAVVISFTTPCDACHLACVSTTFRYAVDSDVVWDCFLPPEYSSNWSSSSSYSATWSALSKKKLYFCTCHNLIHKGKMNCRIEQSFWLDNANTNFMRHLTIPDCRFFKELVTRVGGCPFEIGGKITTSLLSPTTTYEAYLVFTKNRVDNDPEKVTVGLIIVGRGGSRASGALGEIRKRGLRCICQQILNIR